MELNFTKEAEGIIIAEMSGDIDGSSASKIQSAILDLDQQEGGNKILLNMSNVPYMSSAGLRMLLSVSRQIKALEGKLVLVGVSEEIKDVMEMTGFLEFFIVADSIDEGKASLIDN